jgi:hypothetical protein
MIIFSFINITCRAKGTERSGSSDESIVGVEPTAGAAGIVVMFKQLVEKREAKEAADTDTTAGL